MTYRHNPFKPNNPVYTGMFAGRMSEIARTDEILFQTANDNPTHILFIGERGIGKTSLLLVANYFAKGELTWKQPNNRKNCRVHSAIKLILWVLLVESALNKIFTARLVR